MQIRCLLSPLILSLFIGCSSEKESKDPGTLPLIRVSVIPAHSEIEIGATQQFQAVVRGTNESDVAWSVETADAGIITDSGLFTAGSEEGTFTIVATSLTDPSARGIGTVVVSAGTTPRISVSVDPAIAVLATGERARFQAIVEGTDDPRVSWSVREPEGGQVSTGGLYTAPASGGSFTIVATSVAAPSASGTGSITVEEHAPVTVRIDPSEIVLPRGTSTHFVATVTGGVGTREVTWSIHEVDGGEILPSGLYTAPDRAGEYSIVATSILDPSRSATARVVVPVPPRLAGLVPDDRATVWDPGLNPLGGIPLDTDPVRPARIFLPPGDPYLGYSIDPALANADATRAIQKALEDAGRQAEENDRRIVLLPSGTFTISSRDGLEIPSFVTLRGQGPRGANATRLIKPNDTQGAVIIAGQLWIASTQHRNLAYDVPHGASQVTLERGSDQPYQVGELVFISQLEDEINVGSKWNPVQQASSDVRGWFSRHDRPTGQVLQISSTDGDTLSFSTPIRLSYLRANDAQLSRFSGWIEDGPVVPTQSWMGIEDLYVRRGEYGAIRFIGASYSWARNIETEESFGSAVAFEYSFRSVLRDSFVHTTGWPHPGGSGYGLDLTHYSSDNLIENNIFWNFNKVMCMRASGGGNVIGYNYFEDGYGADYPNIPEVALNASHYATPHHELFEGNRGWNISGDSYWGNAITITFFRNHITGRRRSHPPLNLRDSIQRRLADVSEWHFFYSFFGNVLGTPGMPSAPQSGYVYENAPPWSYDPVPVWTIGAQYDSGLGGRDQRVAETTIRHGNYDYVTNQIVWDPNIERQDMPDSFYLGAKPAFFDSMEWPWVEPEDTSAQTHALPAYERFNSLMGSD